MAKRKSTSSKRKPKDRRPPSRGAGVSRHAGETAADRLARSRPAGAEPAAPQELILRSEDIEKAAVRFLEYFTVPRTMMFTAALLAVLLPLAWFVRRQDIAKTKADRYFALGNWEQSAREYESCSEDVLNSPLVSLALARCYLELDNPGEAGAQLQKTRQNLSEVSPKRQIRFERDLKALEGWVFFETEKPVEARNLLYEVWKADSKHPVANYVLARYYLEKQDVAGAATFFRTLAKSSEFEEMVDAYKEQIEGILVIPESELMDVPEKLDVLEKN